MATTDFYEHLLVNGDHTFIRWAILPRHGNALIDKTSASQCLVGRGLVRDTKAGTDTARCAETLYPPAAPLGPISEIDLTNMLLGSESVGKRCIDI